MSQQSQPQQHSQERYQDDNGDAEGGAGGSSQPKHWLDTIVPFVQDTRGVFTEQDDLEGIYSVEGAVQRTDDAKVRELDVVRDRLRALSRQAESYKHSAQRPSTAPSERQHEARLVELDTKRYGLVKTIADLDGAISSAEMQLARAREDTARAAQEDPTLGAEDGMGTVLKLQLCRGMGFMPLEEDEAGHYDKLLISSGKDVHSLAVNGGLSDFEYASKAWLMAG